MASSSGKVIEEIDNAHIICLMYNLLSSDKDNDDLSIGFLRSIDARKRELTNNKTTKRKYHVRICVKDIFGFAEHQDIYTFGWGYKLTLQGNSDNHTLSHRAVTNA